MDVLEDGSSSRFSHYFDIDWSPGKQRPSEKVSLPIFGDRYGVVLESGNPSSFDALHALLDLQAYRLSYWRFAPEEINYRRFFDINTLAAIRIAVPEVFEAAHQLVFELLARGNVT